MHNLPTKQSASFTRIQQVCKIGAKFASSNGHQKRYQLLGCKIAKTKEKVCFVLAAAAAVMYIMRAFVHILTDAINRT